MVTIQTVPNKGKGQTIQTVPVTSKSETWTTSTKTRTITKTLPNSSIITEIVLETTEIPIEPTVSFQPQNDVSIWFSKNDKKVIGISCGILLLMIIGAFIFQIKRIKAQKRKEMEKEGIATPKTPHTPETPGGLRERKNIREEISRDSGVQVVFSNPRR